MILCTDSGVQAQLMGANGYKTGVATVGRKYPGKRDFLFRKEL